VNAPGPIAAAVGRALGRRVTAAGRSPGGDINEAWAVRLDDGEVAFVKTRADAAPGEFATEGGGPRVARRGGRERAGGARRPRRAPALPRARLDRRRAARRAGEEALGRELAALHAAGAPAFGAPPPGAPAGGLRLGALELPAATALGWPAFYAEHRLLAVLPHAGLDAAGRRAVEALAARMDELAGPPEPPARLHGDLWSGNVLAGADGRARLIDPAALRRPPGGRPRDAARSSAARRRARSLPTRRRIRSPRPRGARGAVAAVPLLVHAACSAAATAAAVTEAARRAAA
jgi:fructosamine-3-kinase